jgi:hypothetical protein
MLVGGCAALATKPLKITITAASIHVLILRRFVAPHFLILIHMTTVRYLPRIYTADTFNLMYGFRICILTYTTIAM